MAFWGAPLPVLRPALLAAKAAWAMDQDLTSLQQSWHQQGLPHLTARIGLHTGPAIVGNVGSRQRFNYMVIGDTVNLASRLEGVNKVYGTRIILSSATQVQIQDEFLCRELDLVRVKGRQQPVAIYELLDRLEARDRYPWVATFAAALAAYRAAAWDQAGQLFQEVLRERPGDPPSLCFLRRLEHYHQNPPTVWDGTYNLESK